MLSKAQQGLVPQDFSSLSFPEVPGSMREAIVDEVMARSEQDEKDRKAAQAEKSEAREAEEREAREREREAAEQRESHRSGAGHMAREEREFDKSASLAGAVEADIERQTS